MKASKNGSNNFNCSSFQNNNMQKVLNNSDKIKNFSDLLKQENDSKAKDKSIHFVPFEKESNNKINISNSEKKFTGNIENISLEINNNSNIIFIPENSKNTHNVSNEILMHNNIIIQGEGRAVKYFDDDKIEDNILVIDRELKKEIVNNAMKRNSNKSLSSREDDNINIVLNDDRLFYANSNLSDNNNSNYLVIPNNAGNMPKISLENTNNNINNNISSNNSNSSGAINPNLNQQFYLNMLNRKYMGVTCLSEIKEKDDDYESSYKKNSRYNDSEIINSFLFRNNSKISDSISYNIYQKNSFIDSSQRFGGSMQFTQIEKNVILVNNNSANIPTYAKTHTYSNDKIMNLKLNPLEYKLEGEAIPDDNTTSNNKPFSHHLSSDINNYNSNAFKPNYSSKINLNKYSAKNLVADNIHGGEKHYKEKKKIEVIKEIQDLAGLVKRKLNMEDLTNIVYFSASSSNSGSNNNNNNTNNKNSKNNAQHYRNFLNFNYSNNYSNATTQFQSSGNVVSHPTASNEPKNPQLAGISNINNNNNLNLNAKERKKENLGEQKVFYPWDCPSVKEKYIEEAQRDINLRKKIVEFCQHSFLKVYPKSSRFDSTNFDPVKAWICGVQIAAMNIQSLRDDPMLINKIFFLKNKKSGLVLKPEFLRSKAKGNKGSEALIYERSYSQPLINLKIEVISLQQLHTCFEKNVNYNFDKKNDNIYFESYIIGCWEDDKKNMKFKSKTYPKNFLNCVFNNEFSQFDIYEPEFCFWILKIYVSNSLVARACVPINIMNEGLRSVSLYDEYVNEYEDCILTVKVDKEDLMKNQK